MHRQGLNTKNMKHTTHLTAVEPYVSQSSYFVLTIYMWPVDRILKEFMRRMVEPWKWYPLKCFFGRWLVWTISISAKRAWL